MNELFKFMFIITTFLLCFQNSLQINTYDTYLNFYKDSIYGLHTYDEIANTTWKEFYISENVEKLIKFVPTYIDNDVELDLLVLDSESRLYWVSNLRGTSKEVKHQFISESKLTDFVISNSVSYDNSKENFYILGVSSVIIHFNI